MSTLAKLLQSEGSVDVTPYASPIDVYIGSRVRIRRTSRGMTQKDLSELLDIDCDNLAAYEAGVERVMRSSYFRLPNCWTCGSYAGKSVTA